ncbi:MAG TPA: hypothetical protein VKH43_12230 [Thermoanaerobaculia bacterium]|nr:hypothetical protein [Thermoanaerobaculia bacterium]
MNPFRKRRLVKMFFFVLPAFLILAALMVWAFSALWNGLMPEIFGLRTITYWQALGLIVLSWILFRGFRGPRMARGAWRYDMRRRWERMTPAEREEFVKGLNARCGIPRSPEPEPES